MRLGLFNMRGINKTEHFIPLEIEELRFKGWLKKKKIEYTKELRKKFSKIQKALGPNKDIIRRRKKIEQYALDGTLIKQFDYAGKAAVYYGFNEATIRIAANSKTNIAYKYIWKYTK